MALTKYCVMLSPPSEVRILVGVRMMKLSQQILRRQLELALCRDYSEYFLPEENFQMLQKARKLKRTIDSVNLFYDCF